MIDADRRTKIDNANYRNYEVLEIWELLGLQAGNERTCVSDCSSNHEKKGTMFYRKQIPRGALQGGPKAMSAIFVYVLVIVLYNIVTTTHGFRAPALRPLVRAYLWGA